MTLLPKIFSVHIVWAWRILWSKNFAAIARDQSFLWMSGLDPDSFEDSLSAYGQREALLAMQNHLEQLIGEYDQAINKYLEGEQSEEVQKGKRVLRRKSPTTGKNAVEKAD